METRTIECVAFLYHAVAKGDDFIQKNKFNAASIPVSGKCGEATRARSVSFIFGLLTCTDINYVLRSYFS